MAAAPSIPSSSAQGDFVRQVKDAADIVKIIGEYVRLEKAGAQNYRGLCPFHKEKSPSFNVHASQRFYHCFGCHESGDVLSFVQKLENITFPEALRAVAQKSGVPLPQRAFSHPENAQEARERGMLLDMHTAAAEYFQRQLQTPEGARAREYLTGRNLGPELIGTFGIGYAPDSFTALRDLLRTRFPENLMRSCGLFSSKSQEDGGSGDMYDRFRKRITFPIRNEQGKVIAFTARALETGEKAGPKYLNSPETPLYTKGNVLWNLDLAREHIRKFDFALLVEGQMDAIRVYSAKVPNVIATSGTAFTDAQIRLLSRFSRRVCINFDPDTAGATAAEKSIALLVQEGFEVKVLTLEDGLDPDRFIRERGVQAYVTALRAAPRHTDYLIDRALKLFPARTADSKVKAVNFLLPHMRDVQNRIARDEFVSDAAQKLGVDSALLRQELRENAAKRNAVAAHISPYSEGERLLMRALLETGLSREAARQQLLHRPELFGSLRSAELLHKLAEPDAQPELHALDISGEERAMLARLMLDEAMTTTPELVSGMLQTLELSALQARQRELRAALQAAERSGDHNAMEQMFAEKLQIDRRVRAMEKG